MKPITCKLALDPLPAVIVPDEVELLVRVSCRDLLLPTATVPKFRLALATESPPLPPLELPDRLWHPLNNSKQQPARREANQMRRVGYKFKSASESGSLPVTAGDSASPVVAPRRDSVTPASGAA